MIDDRQISAIISPLSDHSFVPIIILSILPIIFMTVKKPAKMEDRKRQSRAKKMTDNINVIDLVRDSLRQSDCQRWSKSPRNSGVSTLTNTLNVIKERIPRKRAISTLLFENTAKCQIYQRY